MCRDPSVHSWQNVLVSDRSHLTGKKKKRKKDPQPGEFNKSSVFFGIVWFLFQNSSGSTCETGVSLFVAALWSPPWLQAQREVTRDRSLCVFSGPLKNKQNHLKTVGRDEVTARAASGGEQWIRRARNVGSETEATFGRGKEGEKS